MKKINLLAIPTYRCQACGGLETGVDPLYLLHRLPYRCITFLRRKIYHLLGQ